MGERRRPATRACSRDRASRRNGEPGVPLEPSRASVRSASARACTMRPWRRCNRDHPQPQRRRRLRVPGPGAKSHWSAGPGDQAGRKAQRLSPASPPWYAGTWGSRIISPGATTRPSPPCGGQALGAMAYRWLAASYAQLGRELDARRPPRNTSSERRISPWPATSRCCTSGTRRTGNTMLKACVRPGWRSDVPSETPLGVREPTRRGVGRVHLLKRSPGWGGRIRALVSDLKSWTREASQCRQQ